MSEDLAAASLASNGGGTRGGGRWSPLAGVGGYGSTMRIIKSSGTRSSEHLVPGRAFRHYDISSANILFSCPACTAAEGFGLTYFLFSPPQVELGTPEVFEAAVLPPATAISDGGHLAWFQERVAAWRGRLLGDTLARLSRQISYLLEDEEDLGDLSHSPDEKSFDALLEYLAGHPWIKAPSLTLSRNGYFVAHWRPAGERKARISIEFRGEKRVRWSVADGRDTGVPTVVGGICSILELEGYLERHRNWMRLEG